MPVNETLDLQRDLQSRPRAEARPRLHERHLPGAVRRRRGGSLVSGSSRKEPRMAAAPCGAARCAPRSPSTGAPRTQREQLARLRKGMRQGAVDAAVHVPAGARHERRRASSPRRSRRACERRATSSRASEICICAGSGGVGKTTTSAAVAMGMAAQGKKVAVLTIDPAKRLAELARPSRARQRGAARRPRAVRRAWARDEGRAVGDDARRQAHLRRAGRAPRVGRGDPRRVLNNRIYQELSNAMAGSQEYMAMEKLYELHQEARYDLIVLDTPPDPPRARLPRRARAHDAASSKARRSSSSSSPGASGCACSAAARRALLGAQADHRHRPAPGPFRVLPELRRHGAGLQRASSARQPAAGRQAHDLPARDRAGAGPDRRGRVLLAPTEGGEAPFRRGRREQGSSRLRRDDKFRRPPRAAVGFAEGCGSKRARGVARRDSERG